MKKILAIFLLGTALNAWSDLPAETIGLSETLPQPFQNSWVWVTDPLLRRVTLTDFKNDRSLGTIDGGQMLTVPLFSKKDHRVFYVPETHYSRGSRGERTDVITVYETLTLKPVSEIIIPPKRAMNALPIGNAALSNDEQFIAIFNMTPAQSLSIVNTRTQQFIQEIETPGCSLAYGAGERRFMMLCGDGSLLFVSLNQDGTLKEKKGSQKVFNPQTDPIMEKAVRFGDQWVFISYEGYVYPIDTSTENVEALSYQSVAPWSLFSEQNRKNNWRVGGRQLIALHESSNRLYVLLHQGEKDTHKQGGTDLWVYDLNTRQKLTAIKLQSPGITFSGVGTEFGTDWIWPFNKLYNALTRLSFIEPHARPDSIVITQDENPSLLVSGQFTGMIAVYDGLSLELERRITTGNIANLALFLPEWGMP